MAQEEYAADPAAGEMTRDMVGAIRVHGRANEAEQQHLPDPLFQTQPFGQRKGSRDKAQASSGSRPAQHTAAVRTANRVSHSGGSKAKQI